MAWSQAGRTRTKDMANLLKLLSRWSWNYEAFGEQGAVGANSSADRCGAWRVARSCIVRATPRVRMAPISLARVLIACGVQMVSVKPNTQTVRLRTSAASDPAAKAIQAEATMARRLSMTAAARAIDATKLARKRVPIFGTCR